MLLIEILGVSLNNSFTGQGIEPATTGMACLAFADWAISKPLRYNYVM